MINEGLNLMLYGMGTVFVFLTLLIFCTMAMSALLSRHSADDVVSASAPARPEPVVADKRLIAIIESAIAQHRNR